MRFRGKVEEGGTGFLLLAVQKMDQEPKNGKGRGRGKKETILSLVMASVAGSGRGVHSKYVHMNVPLLPNLVTILVLLIYCRSLSPLFKIYHTLPAYCTNKPRKVL